MREFDLSGQSVFIAIPAYRGIFPVETTLNLIELSNKLKEYQIDMGLYVERENAIISATRNSLVHKYLSYSDAEYLFFIDDDIIFEVDDFMSVFALATEYGVVSATYPSRKDTPTFFLRKEDESKPFTLNQDGLLKTIGSGLGFTCIKRSIIQKLYDDADWYVDHVSGDKIKDVFKVGVKDGRFWGEDMIFFQDLYDKYKQYNWVYAYTSLQHQGKKNYGYKLTDYLEKI